MSAIITFSPNTVIKSADVNSNFSTVYNGVVGIQSALQVASGGTELDGYLIGFEGTTHALGSYWISLLSRGSTPVSISFDTSFQSPYNCANPTTNYLNSYGCQIYSYANGQQNEATVGGIATFQF